MNFSENWYTSSHWHKNNTGKVSWTSEVWFQRYEKVLNDDNDDNDDNRQTTRSGPPHSHRRKLFVGDKNCLCSFFSKYVIFKFLHFFLKWCPKGEDLMDKKNWNTPLLKTCKKREKNLGYSSSQNMKKQGWNFVVLKLLISQPFETPSL